MQNVTEIDDAPINGPEDIGLATPADEFFEGFTPERKSDFMDLFKDLYQKRAFETVKERDLTHRGWVDAKGLREDIMEEVAYEVEHILDGK